MRHAGPEHPTQTALPCSSPAPVPGQWHLIPSPHPALGVTDHLTDGETEAEDIDISRHRQSQDWPTPTGLTTRLPCFIPICVKYAHSTRWSTGAMGVWGPQVKKWVRERRERTAHNCSAPLSLQGWDATTGGVEPAGPPQVQLPRTPRTPTPVPKAIQSNTVSRQRYWEGQWPTSRSEHLHAAS